MASPCLQSRGLGQTTDKKIDPCFQEVKSAMQENTAALGYSE